MMSRKKTMGILLAIILLTCFIVGIFFWTISPKSYYPKEQVKIYLYGETHGKKHAYDKEFEIWKKYYDEQGLRDLFIEQPYFTGQFLNLWMKAEDDTILEQVYADLDGTLGHVPEHLNFYKQIKEQCPETVFHGTDVGHQYFSTGERYLDYALKTYGENSEEYRRAKDNIAQAVKYYENDDNAYRENAMVQNFVREYDALGKDAVIVGIYGSKHCDPRKKDDSGKVDCMAKQLLAQYGDVIQYENVMKMK